MSASLNLIPDERLFIQMGLVCISMVITYHRILKPLLRMADERERRTKGMEEKAKYLRREAEALKDSYGKSIQKAKDQAHKNLKETIERKERDGLELLKLTEAQCSAQIQEAQNQIDASLFQSEKKMDNFSKEIVSHFLSKFIPLAFVFFCVPHLAMASSQGFSSVDSVFWPYVQFGYFVVGFVILGRKPVLKLIEKQRDFLKTHLSEAKEVFSSAIDFLTKYQSKNKNLTQDIDVILLENKKHCLVEEQRLIAFFEEEARNKHQETLKRIQIMETKANHALLYSLENSVHDHMNSQLNSSLLENLDNHLFDQMCGNISHKNTFKALSL